MRGLVFETLGRGGWLLLLALMTLGLHPARAADESVSWRDPGPLAAGQNAVLELVFENLEPLAVVDLPTVEGLEFIGSPGRTTSTSFINFQRSSSVTLSYQVRARETGSLRVPPFVVQTDGGNYQVAALNLVVRDSMLPGSPGRPGTPLRDAFDIRLRTDTPHPYAGEVFDVELLLTVSTGRRAQLAGELDWKPEGAMREAWSEPEQLRASGGHGLRFRTRIAIPEPGAVTLPAARQEIQMETGRMTRRGFFSQPEVVQVEATSGELEIEVSPLPAPQPADFTGAVGQFQLHSQIVPESAAVGEPITWTLTLEGTGNWPDGVALPGRAIPRSLRSIQPKSKREFAEGNLFEGRLTEDLVLIPTKPGELTLPPLRFVYFDPARERYETLLVQPPTLSIHAASLTRGGAARSPDSPLVPEATAPTDEPSAPSATPAQADTPLAPPGFARTPTTQLLPRDLKTGSQMGFTPVSRNALGVLLLLPQVAALLVWLGLALHRARYTDPHRERRAALAELLLALGRVEHAPDAAERQRALRLWQARARTLLSLSEATPTAATLRRPGASVHLAHPDGDSERERWARCWEKAEHALYAPDSELPPDWCKRAGEVALRLRVPGFNPLRAFLPQNLLPFLGLVGVLFALIIFDAPPAAAVASPAQATPQAAYQQGDFKAAEAGFAAALAQEGNRNWVPAYNLGASLYQQGRQAEALAVTAAAFLRAPGDPDLRWNMRLFASRMEVMDPVLRRLLFKRGIDGFAWGDLPTALAISAAPASWQLALVLGSAAVGLAFALTLLRIYTPSAKRSRRDVLPWFAGVCLAAGLVLGLLGTIALSQYGSLASPDAGMLIEMTALRTIPTEAETPQAQRKLPAGAILRTERHFLGWSHVRLPNDETGWLRTNRIRPFYRSTLTD